MLLFALRELKNAVLLSGMLAPPNSPPGQIARHDVARIANQSQRLSF